MPICPQCHTHGELSLSPCPNCAGVYLVEEQAWNLYRANPHLGRAIGGRFVVTGELGAGSMARVYEAVQLEVDRPVALKVFREDDVATDAARQRFTQEARVLGKLAHPNNVTMYDFGADERMRALYIAMERVQGQPLRRAMARGLTADATVRIMGQVALALDEAHRLGIVHRDLKPENIIVAFTSTEPHVKVVDFGIAKLLGHDGELTNAGTLFGTPAYMSPEQCRGDVDQVGPHSDVYAVGCMLFEMVTGRLPFEATTPQQMLLRHIDDPVPAVEPRAGVNAPPALLALISRCLQKEPQLRPRTTELVAALHAMVSPIAPVTSTSKVVVPEDQIEGWVLEPPVPTGRAAVVDVPGASILDTYPGAYGSRDPTDAIEQARALAVMRLNTTTTIVFITVVIFGGFLLIAALVLL